MNSERLNDTLLSLPVLVVIKLEEASEEIHQLLLQFGIYLLL